MIMPRKQALRFNKNHFEKAAWDRGFHVVGLDEVGRGCLAGPLVTAAVILPIGNASRLLKDSKIMTLEERRKAFLWIKRHCAYQVGIVHNRLIDRHNIWHATLIAMKKALINLLAQPIARPSSIVVDAMPLNLDNTCAQDIPVYYFAKGEKKSSSIAAASIVAKVVRDELMQTYDTLIPGYALGQHKGYATPCHRDAVARLQQSIIHRHSFLKAFKLEPVDEQIKQQTFC